MINRRPRWFSTSFGKSSQLFRLRRARHQDAEETGIALIEFAICLPLLVILFAGIVDISILLLNYMMFEQSAREGVRTASRLADVDTGTRENHDTAARISSCNAGSLTPGECAHVYIANRARHVLELHQAIRIDTTLWDAATNSDGTRIFTSFQRGLATAANPLNDTVSVEIRGRYDSIVFPWSYPIYVSYRGPYLFQRP